MKQSTQINWNRPSKNDLAKLIVAFITIVIVVIMSSCSSVKKTQHLVNEFSKAMSHEKKDSSQVTTTQKQTDISEAESNTKKIDIVFPDAPHIATDAKDYFGTDTSKQYHKDPFISMRNANFSLPVAYIKTNRPAAVKIKANGDIELSSTPKSITITDNNIKQKTDSSSETTSNNTAVKSDKEQSTETGKKEVQNNVKRTKLFSMWWLLALLLIPAYFVYKKNFA